MSLRVLRMTLDLWYFDSHARRGPFTHKGLFKGRRYLRFREGPEEQVQTGKSQKRAAYEQGDFEVQKRKIVGLPSWDTADEEPCDSNPLCKPQVQNSSNTRADIDVLMNSRTPHSTPWPRPGAFGAFSMKIPTDNFIWSQLLDWVDTTYNEFTIGGGYPGRLFSSVSNLVCFVLTTHTFVCHRSELDIGTP
jgi:hypothetical protein